MMSPGSMRTFAWFPGRSSVRTAAAAAGAGIVNEARPASTVSGDATASDTAKGAGPLRTAVWVVPSRSKGSGWFAWFA